MKKACYNKSSFDVEMQITNKHNLPKRSRAYQSRMDLTLLKPGEDFNRLPTSYVIFICTFDPFSSSFWRYTFDTRCRENGEELGDKAYKIFLNTKGTNTQDEPPELVHFLQYVENAIPPLQENHDTLIRRIETRITDVKRNNSMEVQYMLFGEMLNQERMEGREEGKLEGCQSVLILIQSMSQNGDAERIPLLAEDPELLKEMCEKYPLIFLFKSISGCRSSVRQLNFFNNPI